MNDHDATRNGPRRVDALERWWIKTPLSVRVAICKVGGLPGRLAARRFSMLTNEQKEALDEQRYRNDSN